MSSVRTRRRSVVGLDIEPGYLAAAEVSSGMAVERAATAPLPPGILRDGEVVDSEALGVALRDFFKANHLGKRVRIGVANQRIVVRTVDLPMIEDRKELDAAVRFQAQEQLPMPLEQAVLDWVSLGVTQTDAGERLRVLIVAARRDMIERLLEGARQAGLRPEGIDLSAFAMVRALAGGAAAPIAELEPDEMPGIDPNGGSGPSGALDPTAGSGPNGVSGPNGTTLYVNVGGLTNVALAEGLVCRFTRVVPTGLETVAAALAERRGLRLDHSHQWCEHVGLLTPLDRVEGDAGIVADTRMELAEGVRRIADEVRASIDYYRSQESALGVEHAVLTGPALSIPGFAEQFGTEIRMPVEVRVVPEATPGALSHVDPGRITVAAGLAVEEAPA